MDYIAFKNAYFEGEDAAALRHLAKENLTDRFLLTGDEESHEKLLGTMDADTTALYDRYYGAEYQQCPELLPMQVKLLNKSLEFIRALNVDENELFAMQVNPFQKQSKKFVLLALPFASVYVIYLLLYYFADLEPNPYGAIAAGCGFFSLYLLFYCLRNLRKASRFTKLKKLQAKVTALENSVWKGVYVPQKSRS